MAKKDQKVLLDHQFVYQEWISGDFIVAACDPIHTVEILSEYEKKGFRLIGATNNPLKHDRLMFRKGGYN